MSYVNKHYADGDVLYSSDLNNLIEGINESVKSDNLFVEHSLNLFNPDALIFNIRYSTGSAKLVADTSLPIALSGFIPVEEGEWYTISGKGWYGMSSNAPQGGYFNEDIAFSGKPAIETIAFTEPVSGGGLCFQVPLGKDIKYVALNLKLNADKTQVENNAQLEEGEMATPYVPYELKKTIKTEFLPSVSNSNDNSVGIINEALKTFTTFNNLHYFGVDKYFPKFKKHWLKKDKNLCVVNTGTSLTARSSEHCTEHPDAKFRPPLMHSNNFASHIWDALCWEGQQYRRFDYPGFFAESGEEFKTASNLAEWDDGAYRYGLTRYKDGEGSITFTIPADAWQFNFIYRADSVGSESCVICIGSGNGHVVVLNDDGEWVEANNYKFSQRESEVTYIDKIDYISPNNQTTTSVENYQVKGNTTYQKRLYMKTTSRGAEKLVTITNTLATGRLSYWGVEWSPREYMITYINAARGSHSSAISTNATALNHYQDNEIWSFKPDLFLTEDPIHNAGGAGVPNAAYNSLSYATITDNFFFADNHISMKSRCKDLGFDEPEWIIFNSTLTYNFNGFDQETGELLFNTLKDGLVWSGLDSQSSCYRYINEQYADSNVLYINATKEWCKAAKACYGNLAAATIGSGKNGLTFTNEGSHWNDTGGKVMARIILPVLDFTTI